MTTFLDLSFFLVIFLENALFYSSGNQKEIAFSPIRTQESFKICRSYAENAEFIDVKTGIHWLKKR